MSRFVSAGTDDAPTEGDEAWLQAQQEIDATRQRIAEMGKQDGGKSLFETLQANKAAKQEAFEESIRLKNQFRSLDEDEVEFLDSVLESTRAKEAEVRKETVEQLDAFRRQQEEAERAAANLNLNEDEDDSQIAETWWSGPRKRKKARGRDSAIGGVKLRKTTTAEQTTLRKESFDEPPIIEALSATTAEVRVRRDARGVGLIEEIEQSVSESVWRSVSTVKDSVFASSPSLQSGAGLGLGAYSSDEDEDEDEEEE